MVGVVIALNALVRLPGGDRAAEFTGLYLLGLAARRRLPGRLAVRPGQLVHPAARVVLAVALVLAFPYAQSDRPPPRWSTGEPGPIPDLSLGTGARARLASERAERRRPGRIESVNRAARARYDLPARDGSTGIDKQPVIGPVRLDVGGVEGDTVVARADHGGPDQASTPTPWTTCSGWPASSTARSVRAARART
jgi:hypothetical protein